MNTAMNLHVLRSARNVLKIFSLEFKGKVHPSTGHESPDVGYSFFNFGAGWGGWPTPLPGRFTPGKREGTHFAVGWLDPRAGLDGCGKSRPHLGIAGPYSL